MFYFLIQAHIKRFCKFLKSHKTPNHSFYFTYYTEPDMLIKIEDHWKERIKNNLPQVNSNYERSDLYVLFCPSVH